MTKNASIVIISILMVLVLALGVFTFIPTFAVGEYQEYHAPASLIQLGAGLTDSQVATFSVDEESIPEGTAAKDYVADVTAIIANRLSSVYGMYDSSVMYDSGIFTVTIPTTTHHDSAVKPTAATMLQSIATVGKVELLNTTSQTYDAANVVMDMADEDVDYFGNASIKHMSSGESKYYIVEVKLTNDGLKEANKGLAHAANSVSGYCAIDGTITYQVAHTLSSNKLQVYTGSTQAAMTLASYFNNGFMPITIDYVDSEVVEQTTPMATIVALIFLVAIIAIIVVALVKFRLLSVAFAMTTAMLAIALVIFAGLAYFTVFNVWAIVGFALGLAVYAYCNLYTIANVSAHADKSNKTAVKLGFNASWKRVLIVGGIALALGIILWVIPTGITIALGNALVYSAVATLLGALALNRLMSNVVAPLQGE